MELWIRSKDKEELIKFNNRLFIKEINGIGFGIYNDLCCDDGFINIGVYKTKERALEVLDEIQNILNTYNRVNGKNGGYEDLDLTVKVNMLNYVYEMPED